MNFTFAVIFYVDVIKRGDFRNLLFFFFFDVRTKKNARLTILAI